MVGICALSRHTSRAEKRPIVTLFDSRLFVRCVIISAILTPLISLAVDWEYSVVRGDTLIGVAQRFFIDPEKWREFQQLNGVKQPRKLQPHSTLRIPVEWIKDAPSSAVVAALQGAVKVSGDSGAPDKTLVLGDVLKSGDVVKTEQNGSVSLRFIDGSKILLMKSSSLKLDRLTRYPNTDMVSTELKLEAGRAETQVERFKGAASRYEIRTPMAQLGVRGTDFRVGVNSDANASQTEVLAGAVQAETSASGVSVTAGFGTLLESGKPPLPPIELLAPPDLSAMASRVERTPIRFRWQPMAAATGYRVQIQREDESQVFLDEGVAKTPELSFPDLPDGRYAVRVRGIDVNGLEGLNAQREVIVKARPEPPFTQGPKDKATVRGAKPEFKWAQVAEAASYRFQLAADPELKTTLIDTAELTTTQLATDQALPPGEYYWRVASRRESGDSGPFGDVQQFTLKAIPVVADGATAPPLVDDKQLTLRWKSGSPGQQYRFQLARNRNFEPMLSDAKLTEPEIQLPRPVGGTFFMRMQAIDSDGYEGPFGSPQQIQVAANYPQIKLRADERDAMFTWPAGLDGQKLQLQMARSAKFDGMIVDATTAEMQVGIPRPAGSEFYVRSRRIDSDGYLGEFSNPQRVVLAEQYPNLEPPRLEKDQLTFKWQAPLSGQKVHFQLARDEQFTSLVHEARLENNQLEIKNPGSGRYFVHVGLIDRDSYVAPFGPTQQIDIPRNYWHLLLFLPLLLI